jgi:hypothetical protein
MNRLLSLFTVILLFLPSLTLAQTYESADQDKLNQTFIKEQKIGETLNLYLKPIVRYEGNILELNPGAHYECILTNIEEDTFEIRDSNYHLIVIPYSSVESVKYPEQAVVFDIPKAKSKTKKIGEVLFGVACIPGLLILAAMVQVDRILGGKKNQ